MPGKNLQLGLDEDMFNESGQTTVTPNYPIRATLQTVSLLQHDQQLLEGMVAKTGCDKLLAASPRSHLSYSLVVTGKGDHGFPGQSPCRGSHSPSPSCGGRYPCT